MLQLISISSLLAFVISFGLAIFVVTKNFHSKINISFAFFYSIISIWLFGIFGLVNFFEPGILWIRIMSVGVTFIPSSFFIFVENYLTDKNKPNKYTKYFFVFLSIVFCTLSFTPVFFESIFSYKFGYIAKPAAGLVYPLFVIFVVSIMGYGLVKIYFEYKSANGLRLIQLRNIFLAFLIFTIGGLLVVPSMLGIILFWGFPFWNFSSIISGFIISYTITKDKLLDFSVIIKRNTALIFTICLIIFSLIICNIFLELSFIKFLAFFCICIFWVFTAMPFRNFLVTTARRAFIKGFYDQDKLLGIISNKLSTEKTREEVFQILEQELDTAIQFEKIAFMIAVKNKDQKLIKYAYYCKENYASLEYTIKDIELDNPIIQFFCKHTKLAFFNDLDKEAQSIALDYGFDKKSLFIPFTSPEMMEGFLILGERSGGIKYTEQDFDFFQMLINMVNALLYRLTPYEKIEKQFELNQKELYETQVQLVRAEKIATLAQLTLNTNHELRTPVCTISLETETITKQGKISEEDLARYFEIVKSETKRAIQVIENSIELSSTKKKVPEELNLNSLINETLILLSRTTQNIITKLNTVPNIMGTQSDLVSVILNLINNAIEATPDDGTIIIYTDFNQETKEVILKITDTGKGIPPENMEKIWVPYFSTNVTHGHGLGLSIVHQIVVAHKAHIQVESEIGKGTTFTIKFPAN